jgi:hypothetical protein
MFDVRDFRRPSGFDCLCLYLAGMSVGLQSYFLDVEMFLDPEVLRVLPVVFVLVLQLTIDRFADMLVQTIDLFQ